MFIGFFVVTSRKSCYETNNFWGYNSNGLKDIYTINNYKKLIQWIKNNRL